MKKDIDMWRNKYLRALADYQNLEKRVYQQNSQLQKKANKNLLIKFLNILDNIEQAEIFLKDKGLILVKDNFIKILKEEGVEELDIVGKPYDPHLAECIEVVSGKEDNLVVKILRKGYKLDNEIIRPARVQVSKLKIEN